MYHTLLLLIITATGAQSTVWENLTHDS